MTRPSAHSAARYRTMVQSSLPAATGWADVDKVDGQVPKRAAAIGGDTFLTDGGLETDLIFHDGQRRSPTW